MHTINYNSHLTLNRFHPPETVNGPLLAARASRMLFIGNAAEKAAEPKFKSTAEIIMSQIARKFTDRYFPEITDLNNEAEKRSLLGNRICLWVNPIGLGDTINATPLIRTISKDFPNFKIDVYTHYPEVFEYNPKVDRIFRFSEKSEQDGTYPQIRPFYFRFFHTFSATEKQKASQSFNTSNTHLVDYCALNAFGQPLPDEEKYVEVYSSEDERSSLLKKLEPLHLNLDRTVIIHPSVTNNSRTWPLENWQELTNHLVERGYTVLAVGHSRPLPQYRRTQSDLDGRLDMLDCPKGAINLINQLPILETVALLGMSYALITTDSGLLHLGFATDIFIVGIFTHIHPGFRMLAREGKVDHKFVAVKPRGTCTYCALNRPEMILSYSDCAINSVPECLPNATGTMEAFDAVISGTQNPYYVPEIKPEKPVKTLNLNEVYNRALEARRELRTAISTSHRDLLESHDEKLINLLHCYRLLLNAIAQSQNDQ